MLRGDIGARPASAFRSVGPFIPHTSIYTVSTEGLRSIDFLDGCMISAWKVEGLVVQALC
jgi:hypothetical protein